MFEGTPLGDCFFDIIFNGLIILEGSGEGVGKTSMQKHHLIFTLAKNLQNQ